MNELVERTIQILKRESAEVKSPSTAGSHADVGQRPQMRHQGSSQQNVRFKMPPAQQQQQQPPPPGRGPYQPGPMPASVPRTVSFEAGPPFRSTYPPPQPVPHWPHGPAPVPGGYYPPGNMPQYMAYPPSPRTAPYDAASERDRKYDGDYEDEKRQKKKKKRSERNSKYVKTMGKIAALATALDALDSL